MSTKSRQTIYGGAIIGAKMAKGARKRAAEAALQADRAEAEAWSLQMEAYGGPAQPSPTIGQCLNGELGWPGAVSTRARGNKPVSAFLSEQNTIAESAYSIQCE